MKDRLPETPSVYEFFVLKNFLKLNLCCLGKNGWLKSFQFRNVIKVFLKLLLLNPKKIDPNVSVGIDPTLFAIGGCEAMTVK